KLENDCRMDERILFQNGINPNYWLELRNAKSRKQIDKFKNDFNGLLKENKLLKIKSQIKTQLKYKFKKLMNCKCDYDTLKNVA
ncbi:hypothetical protein V2594_14835, partial [Tenacibaculum maritimum]